MPDENLQLKTFCGLIVNAYYCKKYFFEEDNGITIDNERALYFRDFSQSYMKIIGCNLFCNDFPFQSGV